MATAGTDRLLQNQFLPLVAAAGSDLARPPISDLGWCIPNRGSDARTRTDAARRQPAQMCALYRAETLERRSGKPFRARLGANESSFGPAPAVIAAIAKLGRMPGNTAIRTCSTCAAPWPAIVTWPAPRWRLARGSTACGALCPLVRGAGRKTVGQLDRAYPTLNYHIAGFGPCCTPCPIAMTGRISTACSPPCARPTLAWSISPTRTTRWPPGGPLRR